MAKIKLPTNPVKILNLAKDISDKHNDIGEFSFLTPVITEEAQQKIANGLALNEEAKRLKRQAEKIYKERDIEVRNALKLIKRSRDILKGIYPDNLKKLGDFGFTVND